MSTAFSLAALLGITSSANAALFTYEGFNYGNILAQDQSAYVLPGSPNQGLGGAPNQGDAFGWGANWSTSAGTNQFMSTGLTYANGGTLLVDGGALRTGAVHPLAGNTTAQFQRQLQFGAGGGTSNTLGNIAAANGGTIWMSWLYQNWVNDTIPNGSTNMTRAAYLAFMTAGTTNATGDSVRGGNDIWGVGVGNNAQPGVPNGIIMGGIGANNGVQQVSGFANPTFGPSSSDFLFVMRLDVDNTSANDTLSLWVNPVIGSGVGAIGAANLVMSTNISSVNGFRFQANNNNANGTNAVEVMDELRLGASFNDVTPTVPEPSVIALMGVALSGLFLAVRRKQA